MAFTSGHPPQALRNRRCIGAHRFHLPFSTSSIAARASAAVGGHQHAANGFAIAAVAEAIAFPAPLDAPINGYAGSESTVSSPEPNRADRPIRVADKPAAIALIRRLETAPQTLIRASTTSEQHTYKTIATIATAQKQLKQPNKVLLYVPFTKSATFTALVLPASDSILKSSTYSISGSSTVHKLTVKANTDAKALANTLTFDLIKKGSAVLLSAGAAATAKAATALILVREQLLSRGYEVGVLPRFDEGAGREKQITILTQQVVLQELPTPRVNMPRNNQAPLTRAAAKAQALLQKQRRVQLLLPQNQLSRLTALVAQITQHDEQQQQRGRSVADAGAGKGRSTRAGADKKRLLLLWPPSTAEQLLESLEHLNSLAATPFADAAAAVAADTAAELPALAESVDPESLVRLQVRSSRLTVLPAPKIAPMDASLRDVRKPAVATAESSVTGLAGAIESRVTRAGAAWLRSDGSVQGNTTAWAALLAASSKMDAADGAGGLMALVDVQKTPTTSSSAGEPQLQQQNDAEPPPQQQQRNVSKGTKAGPSLKLKLLIVRYSDIARSILQSPNTPMEVSVTSDLWPLLKFATAANTFLPLSVSSGSGGLLLLPAVLPAPEPAAVAVDYRFEDQSTKQQLVPYAIRLQRFTGDLPQGMVVADSQTLRVSLSTDPIKLRDAIVAKVLQQEPAAVRFVGPLGRTPPLLSIAMAAVAAARVRLQQKGAAFDVGVMPYAETLLPAAAADAEGSAAVPAAAEGRGSKAKRARSGGKQGTAASSNGQSGRVVYSLRLVPLPPVAPSSAAAAAAAAAAATSAASAAAATSAASAAAEAAATPAAAAEAIAGASERADAVEAPTDKDAQASDSA